MFTTLSCATTFPKTNPTKSKNTKYHLQPFFPNVSSYTTAQHHYKAALLSLLLLMLFVQL